VPLVIADDRSTKESLRSLQTKVSHPFRMTRVLFYTSSVA
jgi:hypothetical protein